MNPAGGSFVITTKLRSNGLSFSSSHPRLVKTTRTHFQRNPQSVVLSFKLKSIKMGDYPGDGYKMSSYGLKTYNPQETVGQWTESCKREDSIRKNHLVTNGGDTVANTWKVERPKSLDLTQDTSYFLPKTMHQRPSTYDRINHVVEGYNQKLHRDDREHAKSRGLKVNCEEIRRPVPALSSSIYGHPNLSQLEFTDRKHVRVEICKKDFLRLGGTNIGSSD